MPSESAKDAYQRFAGIYDRCYSQNDYEMWLGEVLLPELEKHGLRKGWALDVGCGTGRAFGPLLRRGWQIVGCDVSSAMLRKAARKFGPKVHLLRLDARCLPLIGPSRHGLPDAGFQLILLLNDVLNYLIDDQDLERTFRGVEHNLDKNGLVIFDANTLSLFREDYISDKVNHTGDWSWRGLSVEVEPGGIYEAELSGPDVETHIHRQRHWTKDQVMTALENSGLSCLAVFGQREKGARVFLSDQPNEERDAKVIYIATVYP